jgi:ribosomal protein L11 methyltransferase
LIRLAVRCSPEIADRVLAELTELAPGGVEEDGGPGYVEYAIYGAPGELPALPDLEAVAGEGLVEVSSTDVPDDWADRWRDFHEPTVIGGQLVVRPSWSEPPGDDLLDVVIDPGQAFGTGAHATTRMCAELLLELAASGESHGSLADLGAGSGVLAIVAARLGWAPVAAVDREPAALAACEENAAMNGVTIELRRADVREQPPPRARTLVANLTALLLRAVAERIEEAPALCVCSGLLEEEADEAAAAFAAAGLGERTRRLSDGWAAISFARR